MTFYNIIFIILLYKNQINQKNSNIISLLIIRENLGRLT